MKILVSGGAGYIGSVVADHLVKSGNMVTVIDNLSYGDPSAIPREANFIEGDIHDRALLMEVMSQGFDALMHFAAFIEAGESMKDPDKYFDNNVVGSYTLFSQAKKANIPMIIFSSTAAVYKSQDNPLTEESLIEPVNVYGQTKRIMEEILMWYAKTEAMRVCVFRYFNAAGASLLSTPPVRGEQHRSESHLIPNILKVALGQKEMFKMFGNDYPTKDGTCVRDYIHVDDLAVAHLLGLEALVNHKFNLEFFNLGNGNGYTNQEVLETARRVTGHPIPSVAEPRREGDAATLVASSEKARSILGWQPKYPDLETIIRSAWAWHHSHPKGYEA